MFDVVTGGAGFIGSHLVDTLVAQGNEVLVIDSLCAGHRETIARHIDDNKVRFVQKDLLGRMAGRSQSKERTGSSTLRQIPMCGRARSTRTRPCRTISWPRTGCSKPCACTMSPNWSSPPRQRFMAMRRSSRRPRIIPRLNRSRFTGQARLACEALISAYCHSFGMKAWIFRFANIIGARSGHGVITDFIRKLEENPNELEILGDGKQTKSYLEVHECIAAMLYATGKARGTVNTFNIGSEDWIDVKSIAEIVTEEMHLPDTKFRFTGGERGWVGDVPKMQLSVEKIKGLRWKPQTGSRESVTDRGSGSADRPVRFL